MLTTTPVAFAQPTIVQGPTNQVAASKAVVTLAVVAQGTPPLQYRWEFNGQPFPSRRPTLRFRARPWRAGTYRCLVRDATGQQRVSSPAVVQVKTRPVILVQPRDTVVQEHDTAVFEAVLNNSGPYTTIVWHNYNAREGSHQIPDGIGLEVHKPRLEIPNSLNVDYYNGLYWLAVTNEVGGTVTRKARLTVVPRQ